jgi:hypothetical protein
MSRDSILRPLDDVWKGENKIVIGIDVGTTQSGVAFAFLEKGWFTVVEFTLSTQLICGMG